MRHSPSVPTLAAIFGGFVDELNKPTPMMALLENPWVEGVIRARMPGVERIFMSRLCEVKCLG